MQSSASDIKFQHSGPSEPQAFTPSELPERVHHYQLLQHIAHGGMGTVHLAQDLRLGRKVAIKFLLRDDEQMAQLFVSEARNTARCEHENIVRIYSVDQFENYTYMVMEYLEGDTLSNVLKQKPSLLDFVRIMTQVARALEHAHGHGIVHRDLKPANIIVTSRKTVKVVDFGIAKCLQDTQRVGFAAGTNAAGLSPEQSTVVGTAPYMSPEQWRGSGVDLTSDFWAVGVMFWQYACNAHPAGSMKPAKLMPMLLSPNELPSLATRAPRLPAELHCIVDKCLVKARAGRYQAANELALDLAALEHMLASHGGDIVPQPAAGSAPILPQPSAYSIVLDPTALDPAAAANTPTRITEEQEFPVEALPTEMLSLGALATGKLNVVALDGSTGEAPARRGTKDRDLSAYGPKASMQTVPLEDKRLDQITSARVAKERMRSEVLAKARAASGGVPLPTHASMRAVSLPRRPAVHRQELSPWARFGLGLVFGGALLVPVVMQVTERYQAAKLAPLAEKEATIRAETARFDYGDALQHHLAAINKERAEVASRALLMLVLISLAGGSLAGFAWSRR